MDKIKRQQRFKKLKMLNFIKLLSTTLIIQATPSIKLAHEMYTYPAQLSPVIALTSKSSTRRKLKKIEKHASEPNHGKHGQRATSSIQQTFKTCHSLYNTHIQLHESSLHALTTNWNLSEAKSNLSRTNKN